MTVQSGRNKLERFSALTMCKWETGLRSLPLLFCALRTVAALIIRPSVCAAPPPGLCKERAFISQICLHPPWPIWRQSPVTPQWVMVQFSSRRGMWGGMQPHQNVKWERQEFLITDRAGRKGKEGGKQKPPKENKTQRKDRTRALTSGSVDVFARAGLCTSVCVQTHQGTFGLGTRQGVKLSSCH